MIILFIIVGLIYDFGGVKYHPGPVGATFFRIVLFYILTILTIGLCINHADLTRSEERRVGKECA